ncbi:unnamed protein product [Darwinula stevensoni]|uniref:Protein FAM76A n=1 Tax=Darwinula stevensoni TaxID=69355 RepID=A0A7R9A2F0_9CRUS|nr:unnamed protein product [Darwinula stevensoni]CAG0885527.1 unnamed protein product [Darwinula stevensoni]
MEPLFACSRCFTKHPFDELSQGKQLCKECRGSYPVVKCTYCRTEFQQESKNSTTSVCKKCEQNVKTHGQPSACVYCNTIAAFVGDKCDRCIHHERKYGPPKTCGQCKQRCAFDRRESNKVDGKLLCWLCMLSYKRALAKTKQTDPTRHSHVRTSKSALAAAESDPVISDHLVAIAQLKEEIAALNKQLGLKDAQLREKDKQITELKASQLSVEQELRRKLREHVKAHEVREDELVSRVKILQKQVASLSKNKSKGSNSNSPSIT